MTNEDDAAPGQALENLRHQLEVTYGGRDGLALLQPLVARIFCGRIALVSSFGAESVVLLHMIATIDRRTPVIFLNTGKLFGETLAYRETIAECLGLADVRDIRPDLVDAGRADQAGDLWNRDADACCWFRKVLPLQRALGGFSAWITGRKRFHGGGRSELPSFEIDDDRIKINPLAGWSPGQVDAYISEHQLPRHPLLERGYSSNGCAPCTFPAAAEGGPRLGRWAGLDKNECGIHIADGLVVGRGADGGRKKRREGRVTCLRLTARHPCSR